MVGRDERSDAGVAPADDGREAVVSCDWALRRSPLKRAPLKVGRARPGRKTARLLRGCAAESPVNEAGRIAEARSESRSPEMRALERCAGIMPRRTDAAPGLGPLYTCHGSDLCHFELTREQAMALAIRAASASERSTGFVDLRKVRTRPQGNIATHGGPYKARPQGSIAESTGGPYKAAIRAASASERSTGFRFFIPVRGGGSECMVGRRRGPF